MRVLCSNQDSILEKGNGDAGTSWGPFVQNIGSHYTDAAGQAKLDTVWKDIKVRRSPSRPPDGFVRQSTVQGCHCLIISIGVVGRHLPPMCMKAFTFIAIALSYGGQELAF